MYVFATRYSRFEINEASRKIVGSKQMRAIVIWSSQLESVTSPIETVNTQRM